MRFGVLGPLMIWTSAGLPVEVPETKVRLLLAALLVRAGEPVSRDRLAEELWDSRRPANPAGALHRKVWQLRRALESAEPGGRDHVVSGPAGYRLHAEPDEVDANRFQRLLADSARTDDASVAAELLTEALSLWRGPALSDFADEEFARPTITRLDEQRLTALEDLAEARLKLGEHGSLIGELSDVSERHPLRERLISALLRALYFGGRQAEALEVYRRFHDRMRAELGLNPGPELVALHQAILRREVPGASDRREPTSTAGLPAAGTRTNLPATRTDLIGRSAELDQASALLESSRLVTLTGPGGVGKTRLAIEVARGLDARFPAGVWLVELADRSRPTTATADRAAHRTMSAGPGGDVSKPDTASPGAPADGTGAGVGAGQTQSPFASKHAASARLRRTSTEILRLIAATMGLRDEPDTERPDTQTPGHHHPTVQQVIRASGRRALLLLDNCEHQVEEVAEVAGLLLDGAPGLRILATSQEPLGLMGEALLSVPPLDLPPPGAVDAAGVAASGAGRLFIARATASSAGFTLNARNAADVATLCRRLDGIPLALELAANRVRSLGTRELVDRLDDRFALFSGGRRDVPARQQTLRAVIDWSWELLTDPERRVLRRLSVQADGYGLETAVAVCSGPGVDAGEVPTLLARLVDRSLVVTVDDETGRRFRLLESVADYSAARLDEADETVPTQRRHDRSLLALAEQADPLLRGPDQLYNLRRFDAEAANLRSAISGATGYDVRLALRLVDATAWYWVLRGRLREGVETINAVLAAWPRLPAAHRARAESWRLGLEIMLGQSADSALRCREIVDLFDGEDDPGGLARAEWFLGHALYSAGSQSESEELTARSLTRFTRIGDRWGVAAALASHASHAIGRSDLAGMRRDGERSAELFRTLGDRWGMFQATNALRSHAEIIGDYSTAQRHDREGLAVAEELGLTIETVGSLSRLGRSALLAGDHASADEFHERARALAAERGSQPSELFAVLGLALSARRQGRHDDAESLLRPWLSWCLAVDWMPGAALIYAELGFIAEHREDAHRACLMHLDSLAAARATDDTRGVALALEGLAGARALQGRNEDAACLLGAAASNRESIGAPLPPAERHDVERITRRARSTAGDEVFDVAFDAGSRLSPTESLHQTGLDVGCGETNRASAHAREYPS
ncbi:putative ATPase/DNA-binding SARP family transcriptional activator [Actinoalloteichus hoggarensis]|uniref:Transcriptional regulatory protein EmbR n=1 Tax=Actinoalloteichus hoggarensis TaxID=1470176 RepID=A0A221VVW4_9PSEU|nr:BTAD domain-containing putative transcriptional regulator [Actinoalloteichus hoggarensis]ASO17689.1 Transcriptional regulatory protein EmbR [Actinoalloteichus hoggarensis]MBB5922814.1 putative ATPase/DNA-binding SARP family transcriptional activator [Actinoalloteichus hoggarensis]